MYQGPAKLTLDAKGRISVPTKHRDALIAQSEGRVTLTRHPDGCLLLYPRPRWETKREELSRLPYAARVLTRIMVGSAVDLELDNAGRLLVPAELRVHAGLEREVMLAGVGEHFELWEPARMLELEQRQLADGLAAAGDFAA